MKKITAAQIRSAKIQGMAVEAFVSGLSALQASLDRNNKEVNK